MQESLVGKSLANLANFLWYTKLQPSNLVLTIDNLLADGLIRQTLISFAKCLKRVDFAKLSRYIYMVYATTNIHMYTLF